jgi:hypothetical protein
MLEATIDAFQRNSLLVAERAREVLVDWTFKAGRNGSPWRTLKVGLEALVALVLLTDEPEQVTWLKSKINEHLMQKPLDVELLDDTGRELRQTAISFRRREFEANLERTRAGSMSAQRVE